MHPGCQCWLKIGSSSMILITEAPGPAPAAKCITLTDFKLLSNEVGIDPWPCSGSPRQSGLESSEAAVLIAFWYLFSHGLPEMSGSCCTNKHYLNYC